MVVLNLERAERAARLPARRHRRPQVPEQVPRRHRSRAQRAAAEERLLSSADRAPAPASNLDASSSQPLRAPRAAPLRTRAAPRRSPRAAAAPARGCRPATIATNVRNARLVSCRLPVSVSSEYTSTCTSSDVVKAQVTRDFRMIRSPTLIGCRNCRSSTAAVTSRLRVCRWQAMAPAMSMRCITVPPRMNPSGLASFGSTTCTISVADSAARFGVRSMRVERSGAEDCTSSTGVAAD